MKSKPPDTIAARLVALREAAGLTSYQLAAKAGVSLQMLRKIETGAQPDPRLSVAVKLAKALGCALAVLAGAEAFDGFQEN